MFYFALEFYTVGHNIKESKIILHTKSLGKSVFKSVRGGGGGKLASLA